MQISDLNTTGEYTSLTVTDLETGKAMCVCARHVDGELRYVNVVVLNASHRAYRGGGREFGTWDAARDGYKAAVSRSMISAAEQAMAEVLVPVLELHDERTAMDRKAEQQWVDGVEEQQDDELDALFGEPISVYTRAQAIDDGELVDVTAQAGNGPDGMIGGFTCPVAVTRSVWALIEAIPDRLDGIADTRGRLHDVLWMARCAVKAGGSRARFRVILPSKGSRIRTRSLDIVAGPGDAGELVLTIGQPCDF